MDLTIEQSCPSCGASIVLKEDDRLIRCNFCDVHNYKVNSVAGRFVLPSAQSLEEREFIYAPYLRFKGSIFYVQDNKDVQYKIVDTTRRGIDNKALPVSLGLRPQAMKVRPVVSANKKKFFIQSVPTKTAFVHAAQIINLFSEKSVKPILHRSFIGETLSRIYQPYYLKGEYVCDGIDNRVIGHRSLLEKHFDNSCTNKISWDPQFISTLCPGCAGLLSGERDSLVLQCRNCESLWQEKRGRFVPVDWETVESEDQDARYLPFWQIAFSTVGYALKSFGDYLRFTNQPVASLARYDTQPLIFWIPGFKINPKAFLQISSQLTLAQQRIPKGTARLALNDHPVTLNQREGLQSIISVLAQTTLSKKSSLPLLAKMTVGEFRCMLTYLPFSAQTHDLVQEHTSANLQSAAIRYGRKL